MAAEDAKNAREEKIQIQRFNRKEREDQRCIDALVVRIQYRSLLAS